MTDIVQVKALENTHATPKSARATKGSLGGVEFDITKWTRAQRAKAAFDKQDPLPTEIIEALARGERVHMA